MTVARHGAVLVASLLTTLFLVFGAGHDTAGVFVAPLVVELGWTRAEVSLLETTVALSAGLVVPVVGWLLDRVEARVTILAVGAPLTLVPLVIAESLGLRRFGSLSGRAGVFNILGAAAGPVAAGRIFDAAGSYAEAFGLYAQALRLGADGGMCPPPGGGAGGDALARGRRAPSSRRRR